MSGTSKITKPVRLIIELVCAGCLAVLLFMLLRPNEYELSSLNSDFINIIIILSGCSFLSLICTKERVRFTIPDGLVILFFGYVSANYFFVSNIAAPTRYFDLILFCTLYFSLKTIYSIFPRLTKYSLLILLLVGLSMAYSGVKQALGHTYSHHSMFRITGAFFNPGPFAGFLSVIMSITAYFLIRHYGYLSLKLEQINKPRHLTKIFDGSLLFLLLCAITFIVCFIIFFALLSRAAILALGITLILILLSHRPIRTKAIRFFRKSERNQIYIIFIAVLLVCGTAYSLYSIKKESADGRVLIYKSSIEAINKAPVFGSGFGSFAEAYAEGQQAYFEKHPDSPLIKVAGAPEFGFNEYVHKAVETGIIGILLLISILCISVIRLYKYQRAMTFGLIPIIIFAFFSYPFSLLPLQVITIIFISAAGVSHCTKIPNKVTIPEKLIYALFYLSGLIFLLCISEAYKQKIEATSQWKLAKHIYSSGAYKSAADDYATLYGYLHDNPRFMFEYGHSLNKSGSYEKSNLIMNEGITLSTDPMFYNIIGNNYKAMGEFANAEAAYLKSFGILPNRIYPLYLLMRLYEESGFDDMTHKTALKIMDFEVKVESSATNDIKKEAQEILNKNKED